MRIYADPEKMTRQYEEIKPKPYRMVLGSLLPITFLLLLIQILFNIRLTGIPYLDFFLFVLAWLVWITFAIRHTQNLSARANHSFVDFDDEQITIKHGRMIRKTLLWPEITKMKRADNSISLSTNEKKLGISVTYALDDIYEMKFDQLHEEVKVRWTAAKQRANRVDLAGESAEQIAHPYERRYYRGIDLRRDNHDH